jgi:hypothetical protein
MEMLVIQNEDGNNEELVEMVEQMARFRGKSCRISEQTVIKTEDHQLAEAIVALLGTDQVKRAQLKTGIHSDKDTPLLTPHPEDASSQGPLRDAHAPLGEGLAKTVTVRDGKERLCPRCSPSRRTILEPRRHFCPEHSKSHSHGKYDYKKSGSNG